MWSWSANKPSTFNHHEERSCHSGVKDYGGRIILPKDGESLRVIGTRFKCWFHHTAVGVYALYYGEKDGTIYVSRSEWDILRATGSKPERALEGVLYVYSAKGLKKYKADTFPIPPIHHPDSLRAAADGFWEALVAAAGDALPRMGTQGPVAVLVSGGTDGLMTAMALREAGADVRAYTSGTDPSLFDAAYAKQYCEHLGIPWKFVSIPSGGGELDKLLIRALTSAELQDFSNVLMSICVVATTDVIQKEIGATVTYHGYYADVLLGNEIQVWGKYLKYHEGADRTDETWRDYRARDFRSVPNTVWIDKVSRIYGGNWNSLFFHPFVTNYVLGLGMEYAPPGNRKILYYDVCDRRVPNGSWKLGKKAGFYTGSGMGALRMDEGPLRDERVREYFAALRPQV